LTFWRSIVTSSAGSSISRKRKECLSLKIVALQSFEVWETTHQMTVSYPRRFQPSSCFPCWTNTAHTLYISDFQHMTSALWTIFFTQCIHSKLERNAISWPNTAHKHWCKCSSNWATELILNSHENQWISNISVL
jgi:hypothetical protein